MALYSDEHNLIVKSCPVKRILLWLLLSRNLTMKHDYDEKIRYTERIKVVVALEI